MWSNSGYPCCCSFGAPATLAILVGIGFHVAWAIASYPRFSALLMALLALFPDARSAKLEQLVQSLSERQPLVFPIVGVLGVTGLLGSRVGERVFLVALLLLAAAVAWALVRDLIKRTPPPVEASTDSPGSPSMRWSMLRALAIIAPLSTVASGLNPCLGLGTDRAFALYGNLRTKGDITNHLRILASPQPFSLRRDMAIVDSASVRGVVSPCNEARDVPFAETRARLSDAGRLGLPSPSPCATSAAATASSPSTHGTTRCSHCPCRNLAAACCASAPSSQWGHGGVACRR